MLSNVSRDNFKICVLTRNSVGIRCVVVIHTCLAQQAIAGRAKIMLKVLEIKYFQQSTIYPIMVPVFLSGWVVLYRTRDGMSRIFN